MIMASSFSFTLFLLLLHQSSPSSTAAVQQTTYPSSSSLAVSNFPWNPTQNRTLQSYPFSAGFLQTTDSRFKFSVWYTVDPGTVLWSIITPVSSSAMITITSSGELMLSDHSSNNLWPGAPKGGTNLTLTKEGNLVFGAWESFNNPTDTFLPNQNITGLSLISDNGNYSFDNGTNLTYKGFDVYWQSPDGCFQGLDANGMVTLQQGNSIYSSDYGAGRLRRLKLENQGNLNLYSYNQKKGRWVVVWQVVQAVCSIHGLCGRNEICYNNGSNDNFTCICPYNQTSSGQCEIPYTRITGQKTRFVRLDYVSYTGEAGNTSWASNYDECQKRCTSDPDCLGFWFKYDGRRSCEPQRTHLRNGFWSPGTEAAMFLRINGNASDPVKTFTGMTDILQTTCNITVSLPVPPKESNTTTRNIVIITQLFVMELVIGVVSFWAFLKKYVKYRDMARTLGLELLPAGGPKRFSYAQIKQATEGFSTDNAIGRGAFGDVYKGVLSDHRVVAVKCLKDLDGGDAEFWAEVTIIARMHHLNLVRLWGFCNEKGHRILVYEYVPNGSLDKYLFRSSHNQANTSPQVTTTASDMEDGSEERPAVEEKPVLDWNIRYRIAVGVARAIAYLHEECLEWVLHCDIKPENILLGDDFCPKISDFGLSKLKKKEQAASTMSGIRGTPGYLAPEWIRHDPITPKADVYSFGMVLLEMVIGTRSSEQQKSQMDSAEWYLPTWAFDKAYKEMNVEDVLDRQIRHIYDEKQHLEMVSRMVRTAIWCLQERPDMRPSMGKVAKMLEGTVEIMEPPKPTIHIYHEENFS
ncbi:G-type lectin S-receptor-like serine/threonine-protein kinase-like protein [Drosera capensis]